MDDDKSTKDESPLDNQTIEKTLHKNHPIRDLHTIIVVSDTYSCITGTAQLIIFYIFF